MPPQRVHSNQIMELRKAVTKQALKTITITTSRRTSARKASCRWSVKSGRTRWSVSRASDLTATSGARSPAPSASFSPGTQRSKVTINFSSMATLWKCLTTSTSRRRSSRSPSSMCVLIISSVRQTFPSLNVSKSWRVCSSRTITSTASFRFQSWRRWRAWWVYRSREMKFQTRSSCAHSSSTASLTSRKSTIEPFLTATNSEPASNSSTSTRFYRRRQFLALLPARAETRRKVRRIARLQSKTSAWLLRKMRKRHKILSLGSPSIVLAETSAWRNWTTLGRHPSN